MEKLDKIIQVLSLVSSDKRQETVEDLILFITYSLNEPCTLLQVNEFVDAEFKFKLLEEDLQAGLTKLETNGKLIRAEGKYKLAGNITDELSLSIKRAREKSSDLFTEFSIQIDGLSKTSVTKESKDRLFAIFQNYIYECVYLYGRESINVFRLDTQIIKDQRIRVLRESIAKISDSNEKELISSFIKGFPDNLTLKQIDLIHDLISRSENFYSLGLSEAQSDELKTLNILDWVVYLDTNVLYSILNLHEHPENEACKKLIEIVNSNPELLKIKFSFLQKTHDELLKKKEQFKNIPKTIYPESQIRAMLKSALDPFTQSYLKNMLVHGENTPHPLESLNHHIRILKSKGIEINRKDLSGIDENSEQFKQSISDYRKIESILNEAKAEKGHNLKSPKDINKIDHDIFLREAVRRLRIAKPSSMKECKHFALTLDSYLLKYDNYQLRGEPKKSDLIIPTFFKPSFLLSKLTKFLPVITEDYKRAFVKSISTL